MPALEEYDREMRQVVSDWLDLPALPDHVCEQALLPIRMDGLGFSSTAELVWSAFAGSLSAYLHPNAGPAIMEQRSEELLERMRGNRANNSHNRDAVQAYEQLIAPKAQAKREAAAKKRDSPSSLPFVPPVDQLYGSKASYTITTQEELTKAVHEARVQRLKQHNDYLAVHLTISEAPGANAFLLALPTEEGLRFPHKAFKRIIRSYLGMSPISRELLCICTKKSVKEDESDWDPDERTRRMRLLPNDYGSMVHLAVCKCLGGGIHRHDTCVNLYREIFRSISDITHQHEVSNIIPNHRADLIVHSSSSDPSGTIYDVSITNPHISGMRQKAKTSLLHAAKEREAAKTKIWEEACKRQEYKFRTLAFEHTGGLGSQNQVALRQWAEAADAQEPYEPANWAAPTRLTYWKQRLSVALMRGLDRQTNKLLERIRSLDSRGKA